MNKIVLMKFGSHLYGTDTPNSDKDYKGVFLPNYKDILLGKIPNHFIENSKKNSVEKNSKDDIDSEIYSLHYFIKLALKGETVAIDMIHAPESCILEKHEIWDEIIKHRTKFYSKNIKSFVGYARTQATRYGDRGNRLKAAKTIFTLLNNKDCKLQEMYDSIPEIEHVHKFKTHLNILQVCGKQFQETANCKYICDVLDKFIKQYGHRSELAEKNEGIDLKAMSHALRAVIQMKELLTLGTINFPLKEAGYLKALKLGKLDFKTEVSPKLDALLEEVEVLTSQSNLPDVPDRVFWDRFIIDTVEQYVIKKEKYV